MPAAHTTPAGPLPLPGRLAATMTGASVTVAGHRVIAAQSPLPASTAAVPIRPAAARTVHPATGGPSRETRSASTTSVRHGGRSPLNAAPPTATQPAAAPPTATQPAAAPPTATQPAAAPPTATQPTGVQLTTARPTTARPSSLQPSPQQPSPHHLLLRQMIPQHATPLIPAIADLIRRAPAAPPVGTPRRHTVRIPDSFAADTSTAVAASRTRRPPPVPASVTASPASAATNAASATTGAPRASLLDKVQVSLFERARAGMSSPAAAAGIQPAHPAGIAQPRREPFAANHSGSGPIRRFTGFGQIVSTRSAMTDIDTQAFAAPAVADALTPREWDELVDLIVDKLEDRVLDELARRGRRFSPGVF